MSLATDLRPQRLDDVIGCPQNLLAHYKKHGSFPRAILLTGEPGTGKTTIARIVSNGALIRPEVGDMGVAAVRDLVDYMRNMPLVGDRTVALIDEAHGLSKEAQRALLQPVEDTEGHAYWILATNEPERLSDALRSRLFRVALRPLETKEQVTKLLLRAQASSEQIEELWGSAERRPRFLLQMLEDGRAERDKAAPAPAFDMVRLYYKQGPCKELSAWLYSVKADELVNFQFVGAAYGVKCLARDNGTNRQRLMKLLNTHHQEPQLRAAEIVLNLTA